MDPKSRSLRLRSAGKQNFGMVEIGGRAEIFFFFFWGGWCGLAKLARADELGNSGDNRGQSLKRFCEKLYRRS